MSLCYRHELSLLQTWNVQTRNAFVLQTRNVQTRNVFVLHIWNVFVLQKWSRFHRPVNEMSLCSTHEAGFIIQLMKCLCVTQTKLVSSSCWWNVFVLHKRSRFHRPFDEMSLCSRHEEKRVFPQAVAEAGSQAALLYLQFSLGQC